MKVKDLMNIIINSQKQYPDFLEWQVALEQHPDYKQCSNCNKPPDSVSHKENGEETIFIKSHCGGCCSYWENKKTFGIQIHY